MKSWNAHERLNRNRALSRRFNGATTMKSWNAFSPNAVSPPSDGASMEPRR